MIMRIQRLLTACLAAALVAPALGAQKANFIGTLAPAELASFCQEETHYLECSFPDPFVPTGVLLKSSTLDLSRFEGKRYEFEAFLRGVECPIWNVTSATPATASLTVCGSATPGCPMRLRVGPTGVIGQYLLFLAFAPDFVPIPPGIGIEGTVLVAPPAVLIGAGPTVGDAAAVDLVIPPDVSFTGVSIWFQGMRRHVGPVGPWEMTDAACFTITGPSPPCHLPNC
jgi:hypothetical protein